ncbi:MAG: membrane protein insertion efficiency factor YidD [Saccharofermentanales bacterium]
MKTENKDEKEKARRRSQDRPSFPASALLGLITFYQRFWSPNRPACCRFSPTCSAYAAEAIRTWGAVRGTGLALWRVLRCNPLSKGGYDPVPGKSIGEASVCCHQTTGRSVE